MVDLWLHEYTLLDNMLLWRLMSRCVEMIMVTYRHVYTCAYTAGYHLDTLA